MKLFTILLIIVVMVGCGEFFGKNDTQPCSVTKISNIATITCPDGSVAELEDGDQGLQGVAGSQGQAGHSALVKSIANAASLTDCPSGGSLLLAGTDQNDDGVLDGMETTASLNVCNGAANTSVFTPIAAIQPCGANSSSYKEVLLGLFGGEIFATFSASSDALTVRNTLLPNGSYQNTDSSHCAFTVATNGVGNRIVSWSNGYYEYSTITKTWTQH